MNIKIRPTDTKYSLYIRAKHRWTCEFCGRVCRSLDGKTIYFKLEAMHYYSRSHENTRFDDENVRAGCFQCHMRFGGHTNNEQGEFDLWMKEKLGEIGYRNLRIRANTYKKRDDKLDSMIIKQLIKE